MPSNEINKIPDNINICILLGVITSLCTLLWVASHTDYWSVAIISAFVFSFVANTSYSLMHEAVHKHFHSNGFINAIAGRFSAACFPTAFSLQRVFHLAHHKNNRSDHERFDYYAPHENRFIKSLQWYCILTGLYWFISPLVCILYFFTAELFRWRTIFGKKGEWFAKQTSAEEFLEALDTVPIYRARLDILSSFLVQLITIWALGISIFGWVICYGMFAINWSSLQYTDHAFSELDKKDGAWNLKVNPLTRFIFLNYHYHQVHHRDPSIPWNQLPQHVRENDPNPSFWDIYLEMWKGPKPLPTETQKT